MRGRVEVRGEHGLPGRRQQRRQVEGGGVDGHRHRAGELSRRTSSPGRAPSGRPRPATRGGGYDTPVSPGRPAGRPSRRRPAPARPSGCRRRAGRCRTRRCASASCSTMPSPHSTTVTASSTEASRSRSSISARGSAASPSRYASACTSGTRPPRAGSGRCTRAITKVGEVTSPRTPSPAPMPCASAVLPAPSGPVSSSRSPARSTPASRRPNSWVSSTVDSVTDSLIRD